MTDASTPEFGKLYDAHFSRVYNYIRYRVPDAATADDVTSRVFEKALAAYDSYDPSKAPVDAWLFSIARNAVNDHFRLERWRSWLPFDLLAERPGPELEISTQLAEEEALAGLLAAIAQLDEREREIIALRFGADMTNRDISAHLGLGESNIAVILFRAIKKIREHIKTQERSPQ